MILFNIIEGQSCNLIEIIKQNLFYLIFCEVSSSNNIFKRVSVLLYRYYISQDLEQPQWKMIGYCAFATPAWTRLFAYRW